MPAAAATLLEAGDFALGRCPECRREVLTYPEPGERGAADVRRCLHCDERVRGELRWIDAMDLEALGYELGSPSASDDGGCVSCTRGGCGVAPVAGK